MVKYLTIPLFAFSIALSIIKKSDPEGRSATCATDGCETYRENLNGIHRGNFTYWIGMRVQATLLQRGGLDHIYLLRT